MAGARHYSQLVSWQLADALRSRHFQITRRPPFFTDFKHRSQAEDAIDSVCRNIAEGFGCASHAEFARYLEISRRSLNELCDSAAERPAQGVSRNERSARRSGADAAALSQRWANLIAYLNRNSTGRSRCRSDIQHGIISEWRFADTSWICCQANRDRFRRRAGAGNEARRCRARPPARSALRSHRRTSDRSYSCAVQGVRFRIRRRQAHQARPLPRVQRYAPV